MKFATEGRNKFYINIQLSLSLTSGFSVSYCLHRLVLPGDNSIYEGGIFSSSISKDFYIPDQCYHITTDQQMNFIAKIIKNNLYIPSRRVPWPHILCFVSMNGCSYQCLCNHPSGLNY